MKVIFGQLEVSEATLVPASQIDRPAFSLESGALLIPRPAGQQGRAYWALGRADSQVEEAPRLVIALPKLVWKFEPLGRPLSHDNPEAVGQLIFDPREQRMTWGILFRSSGPRFYYWDFLGSKTCESGTFSEVRFGSWRIVGYPSPESSHPLVTIENIGGSHGVE